MLRRVDWLSLGEPAVEPIGAGRSWMRAGPILRRPPVVSFPSLSRVVPLLVRLREVRFPLWPRVVPLLVRPRVVHFLIWPGVMQFLRPQIAPILRAVVLPAGLERAVVRSVRLRPDIPASAAVPVAAAVA
jgi:hypothetical protein